MSSSSGSTASGFTLLEVMCAFAILTLMTGHAHGGLLPRRSTRARARSTCASCARPPTRSSAWLLYEEHKWQDGDTGTLDYHYGDCAHLRGAERDRWSVYRWVPPQGARGPPRAARPLARTRRRSSRPTGTTRTRPAPARPGRGTHRRDRHDRHGAGAVRRAGALADDAAHLPHRRAGDDAPLLILQHVPARCAGRRGRAPRRAGGPSEAAIGARNAGFTLIEIVVAATILGVVVVVRRSSCSATPCAGATWSSRGCASPRSRRAPRARSCATSATSASADSRARRLPGGTSRSARTRPLDFVTARTARASRAREDNRSEDPARVRSPRSATRCAQRDDGKYLELWRREDFFVDDDPTEGGQYTLIYDRIRSFELTYFDRPERGSGPTNSEGIEEWDSRISAGSPTRSSSRSRSTSDEAPDAARTRRTPSASGASSSSRPAASPPSTGPPAPAPPAARRRRRRGDELSDGVRSRTPVECADTALCARAMDLEDGLAPFIPGEQAYRAVHVGAQAPWGSGPTRPPAGGSRAAGSGCAAWRRRCC